MTHRDTELIKVSVTVTGTRSTGHKSPENYSSVFARYLGPFAGRDARFYIGGAQGIDSLALLWLAGQTEAGLVVVTPDTLDRQPTEAQEAVARTRERISAVVELKAGVLQAASYHARNRWMVDHSDMTIGFPLGDDASSGTWQTLRYTAQQGKPRLIVPVQRQGSGTMRA